MPWPWEDDEIYDEGTGPRTGRTRRATREWDDPTFDAACSTRALYVDVVREAFGLPLARTALGVELLIEERPPAFAERPMSAATAEKAVRGAANAAFKTLGLRCQRCGKPLRRRSSTVFVDGTSYHENCTPSWATEVVEAEHFLAGPKPEPLGVDLDEILRSACVAPSHALG